MSNVNIQKELEALRALGAEILQRASRLEKELVPAGTGPAPRKGRKPDYVTRAMDRRNRHILKKSTR